jgi:hypothetical protein
MPLWGRVRMRQSCTCGDGRPREPALSEAEGSMRPRCIGPLASNASSPKRWKNREPTRKALSFRTGRKPGESLP